MTKQNNSEQLMVGTFEEALSRASSFGILPGLEVMGKLLEFLDNPQDRLPIIHVAGTNGKGSVCAMLEAVFREAGYRTGLYTSPHLSEYGERFRINGEKAPISTLQQTLEQVSVAADQVEACLGRRPTEFEILTAMGFLYFVAAQVEILILEVGMGGRLDATNLVKHPIMTVITNVSLDHENFLGNDVAAIAYEKAGIIKPGVSLVCASEDAKVRQVIQSCFEAVQGATQNGGAETRNTNRPATLSWVTELCQWQLLEETLLGQKLALQTPKWCFEHIELPLSGSHQQLNLATALCVVEQLTSNFPKLTQEKSEKGIAKVRWPGRLEIVSRQPMIILDGAHNPAGMKYLADWLKRQKFNFRRVILVIGMLFDKDRQQAAAELEPLVEQIIVTRAPSYRALEWQSMAQGFVHTDAKHLAIIEDCHEALAVARSMAEPEDLILVTGSLYLIGLLRTNFE
jgi:dihydrofolate synthase/folylpolyglutamate synthase